MNYRHHFHAGNFADVMKHLVLLGLVSGLQRKEKGFLYLDTHAGRGAYDLAAAARGDSLVRQPEWPDGIGRLQRLPVDACPPLVREYLAAVQRFAEASPLGALPYPGSPWLVHARLRPGDRMVLYERHAEEHAALAAQFQPVRRVRVEHADGYGAVAACLPPVERRALVLIDPPYEAVDEFEHVLGALAEGLRRLPGGTFAIWYPLTERARVDAFLAEVERLPLPPAWVLELQVRADASPVRMKGCGLLVVNPPWQFDRQLEPVLPWLADTLAQDPGARAALRWLVPE